MIDFKRPYGVQFPTGLLEQDGKLYQHNGQPYVGQFSCEICGKEFDTEKGLLLHGRKVHVVG